MMKCIFCSKIPYVGGRCGYRIRLGNKFERYCTRDYNHKGPHIFCGSKHVMMVKHSSGTEEYITLKFKRSA